jgi:hypothetical protein
MINIRYHIVSITAVFLALGIGIALGSTFLDGATVDVLNRNIADAERRIGDSRDRIDELEGQVADAQARDDALIIFGTDRLLDDALTDQPVLVVTEPGIDDGEVDALRSVLERSGADLRGTLALSDRLAFADGEVDEDLATALELDGPTATELRTATTSALVDALAAAGAPAAVEPQEDPTTTTTTTAAPTTTAVPGSTVATSAPTTTAPTTTTTTVPGTGDDEGPVLDGEQPAIVTALLDGGYAELAAGPGREQDDPILEQTGYRYVFVGSADPDPAGTEVLLSLLPADDGVDALPAIVAAGTQAPPAEDEELVPTVVARVRADDARAERYTTVDDIETFAGLASVVISVAEVGEVAPGHYGQADGASAVLPPLP